MALGALLRLGKNLPYLGGIVSAAPTYGVVPICNAFQKAANPPRYYEADSNAKSGSCKWCATITPTQYR